MKDLGKNSFKRVLECVLLENPWCSLNKWGGVGAVLSEVYMKVLQKVGDNIR